MNDSKISTITRIYYEDAKNIFGNRLRSMILYGSCAKKDYDDESDIDIMILLDIPREEISTARKMMRPTANRLDLEYDCVISSVFQSYDFFQGNKEVLPFYQNVEKEGILIG